MRLSIPHHPAPYALLAGLAITGCGGHRKVQRSDQPVAITVSGAGGSGNATTKPTTPRRIASGTFTGKDILTKFGDVQVSVTLRHGRIVDVQWLKIPLDRARSRYISQTASPILRSEVLSAQSAHINLLSGATYTSDAWANSVQSALTQAH